MTDLIYIDKVYNPTSFDAKVRDVAAKLLINPNWLMQVMWSESRLKPTAVNRYSGASGLLQFTNVAIDGWGISLQDIRQMDAIAQMDLCYKYLYRFRGKINSYYDLYAAVFFPSVVGKPDGWVLHEPGRSQALIAAQNKVMDYGNKGYITVSDFKRYVKGQVLQANWNVVFNTVKEAVTGTSGIVIAGIVIGVFLLID